MRKIKTVLIVVATVIVLSVVLYFLPLNKVLSSLPLINKFYNNTTLEVIVEKGKANITINGKDYGQTPTTVENLPEGKYTVELSKITDSNSFYEKHTFEVELVKNTSARIDVEIGPESTLNGTILYYTEVSNISDDKGLLAVSSSATNAKIYIDKEYIGESPLSSLALRDNQYQIKVEATGYETIEIPVFVRKGYQLNLKTYHFPIPVNFDSVNN